MDPVHNPKIIELLEVLSSRGLNDEAIKNVRDGLLAQSHETFMDQVLASLTDEDLQQVEASETQEEANQKFAAVYETKTGKNMQEEMTRIIDQYADDLITKYKVEEGEVPAISTSIDATIREDEAKFFPSGDEAVQTTPPLETDASIPPVPPLPEDTTSQPAHTPEEEKVHDLN